MRVVVLEDSPEIVKAQDDEFTPIIKDVFGSQFGEKSGNIYGTTKSQIMDCMRTYHDLQKMKNDE